MPLTYAPRSARRLLSALLLTASCTGFAVNEAALDNSVGVTGIEVQRDVPYLEEGRTEKLDLYLPMPASSRRGAVVWIHGGGWAGGKKTDQRELMVSRSLASEGYVVASIDYALASNEKITWPLALHDCKNAVRFLRSNAQKYGIDPDKIAVAGGSAGAHLALMVAYTSGKDGLEPQSPYPGVSSDVGAVIELYGITNLISLEIPNKDGSPSGRPQHGNMQRRFTGQNMPEGRAVWREASPVTYVRRDLPPTFISHGKRDTTIVYSQALELADALKEVGAPYELVLLDNSEHTYSLTHRGKSPLEQDLTQPVVKFLEKSFNQAAK